MSELTSNDVLDQPTGENKRKREEEQQDQGAIQEQEKKQKVENNKRKREDQQEGAEAEKSEVEKAESENGEQEAEEEQEESANKKQKTEEENDPPHFLHYKYLTKEIFKACSTWSDVAVIEGKCKVVYWNFDYTKFCELTGLTEKDIAPIRERLYCITPWLQSAFGYSPQMTEQGIQNNLRVTMKNYISKEEGVAFENACKQWDEFILETALEKSEKDEWPIKSMFTLKPGKKLDMDLLEQKYKWIIRPSKNPKYPPYINFKFQTQKADAEKGIPEDKTTAIVTVWNNQRKEDPPLEKLTAENIVPKKGESAEGKTVVIDRGDYVKTVFWFQKIYFTNDSFGPTLIVDEVNHDTDSNLRNSKNGGKKSFKM